MKTQDMLLICYLLSFRKVDRPLSHNFRKELVVFVGKETAFKLHRIHEMDSKIKLGER
jgi:hypothetical protein